MMETVSKVAIYVLGTAAEVWLILGFTNLIYDWFIDLCNKWAGWYDGVKLLREYRKNKAEIDYYIKNDVARRLERLHGITFLYLAHKEEVDQYMRERWPEDSGKFWETNWDNGIPEVTEVKKQ